MGTAAERSYLRLKTSFPLGFVKTEGEKPLPGRGLDISSGGLAFETHVVIPAESLILLEFRLGGLFHKIKVSAKVIRQVPPKELSKQPKYLTAVQFKDLSEKNLDMISNFIIKKTRNRGIRWTVLILGVVVFKVTVLRVLDALVLGYYFQTPFGREWLTGPWSGQNLLVYASTNFIFASAVLCAIFEVFFMRRWAVKLLIVLSAVGLLSQIARLSMKLPLAVNDNVIHVIIGAEVMLGLTYLFFIFLLAGRDFKERLEAHWAFLSHQEFDRKKSPTATV